MDAELRNVLRKLILSIRHLLEGYPDDREVWQAGDLEQRMNQIGVWRDRQAKPLEELPWLSEVDKKTRRTVDAYIKYREETGINRAEAVEEFICESTYTWVNRLFALRCMEARGIIDEIILKRDIYGGRSLQHNRLAISHPELCTGEDDGLYTVLFQEFQRRTHELPMLFNSMSPAIALRPSVSVTKQLISILSGLEPVNGVYASDEVFKAPDAFSWAYQYWNTEEKDRIFERTRTDKTKIEGKDIIPVTCLYTEPYMVKFLVQNSLGAQWSYMHPESRLFKDWEYYVRDADRTLVEGKFVREITFMDPACGSGHFLLEAFDLYHELYREEGELTTTEDICASILNNNLFGIDIDERAVQISKALLWMKAKENAPHLDFSTLDGFHEHLVATNIMLPKGRDHLHEFLLKYPEDRPFRIALESIFEALENVHEIGSLLKIEDPLERAFEGLRTEYGIQATLWSKGSINVDSWRKNIIDQLQEHFNEEAVSAELSQVFFGQSMNKGLKLLDLLSSRYDIVATNPPYMGSKNMSLVLKNYLNNYYQEGARDLYAAFISRCTELAQVFGRIGMVTQQSWLFLKSFSNLRSNKKNNKDSNKFSGIFNDTSIEIVVNLGPVAFEEISGEVVNVVLFILNNVQLKDDRDIYVMRLLSITGPDQKAKVMKKSIREFDKQYIFTPKQSSFLEIPESPFAYWLTPNLLDIYKNSKRFGEEVVIRQGLVTGNVPRFVRSNWEVNRGDRWYHYPKGGGFKRWFGLNHWLVDWEHNGARIKASPSKRVQGTELYFHKGLTYTHFASRCFNARMLLNESIFSDASGMVFIDEGLEYYLGILNSRIFTFLIRVIVPGNTFREGYISKTPIPNEKPFNVQSYIDLVKKVIKYQTIQNSFNLIEYNAFSIKMIFDNKNLQTYINDYLKTSYSLSGIIHTIEYIIEMRSFEYYDLTEQDVYVVLEETGKPCGMHQILLGYDEIPTLPDFISDKLLNINKYIEKHEVKKPSNRELQQIMDTLRVYYEKGPGFTNNEEISVGLPMPSESFIEELAHQFEIHPLSVHWLIRKGIEEADWHSLLEERRIAEDKFSVIILRLLSHSWPKQIETGEPVPKWADPDGIVPITEGTNELTLLDRIRKRLNEDFKDGSLKVEREFEEIMSKPLEEWLLYDFFKHHTSQFKKRPVVWQIQSTPRGISRRGRGKRITPAFSCLVCYQKVDGDTLHKIRSQYVQPLKNGYETELRTLVTIGQLNTEQTVRRTKLESLIDELERIDTKLQGVINEGFNSIELEKFMGDESLDGWCSIDGEEPPPDSCEELYLQERAYIPDINDGVRVNIAPLQKAGLLASEVLAKKDVERVISDRAEWRIDERRLCREGKLPQPRWWEKRKPDDKPR